MRYFCAIIIILFASSSSFAQSNSQFTWKFSPNIQNPSFAGIGDYKQLNLIHAQSVLGIKGAPQNTWLSFQLPTRKKLGFAGVLNFQQEGVFTNTQVNLGMSYRLTFGKKKFVFFGLSAGANLNSISVDLEKSSSVPISQRADNTIDPTASLGIHAQINAISFGFAIPALLSRNPTEDITTAKVLGVGTDFLTAFLQYDISVNRELSVTPTISYISQNKASQIEIGGIASFNETFQVGLAYLTNYGPQLNTKFQLTENFALAYAYGYNLQVNNGVLGNHHELNLQLNFGRKIRRKKYRKKRIVKNKEPQKTEKTAVVAKTKKEKIIKGVAQAEKTKTTPEIETESLQKKEPKLGTSPTQDIAPNLKKVKKVVQEEPKFDTSPTLDIAPDLKEAKKVEQEEPKPIAPTTTEEESKEAEEKELYSGIYLVFKSFDTKEGAENYYNKKFRPQTREGARYDNENAAKNYFNKEVKPKKQLRASIAKSKSENKYLIYHVKMVTPLAAKILQRELKSEGHDLSIYEEPK